MEPVGSMPHSQGFSNNSYPEPNQPNYPHKTFKSQEIYILQVYTIKDKILTILQANRRNTLNYIICKKNKSDEKKRKKEY